MTRVTKTLSVAGKGYLVASSNVSSRDVKLESALEPGSKRGFWTFDDSTNARVLTTPSRLAAQNNVLSCAQSGGVVDLWSRDDGSGRQVWNFELASGSGYYISVSTGIDDPSAKYLVPCGTGVHLSSDKAVWIVEDAPTPTPPEPPTPPTPTPGDVTAIFIKPSAWEGGFQGLLTIVNGTSSDLAPTWSLTFDYPGDITWISDVTSVQDPKGKWTWKPNQWTKAIPAKGKLEIGFGGTVGEFTNVKFSTAPPTPPGPVGPWPSRYFAPYSDVTLWPTPDLVAISKASGTKRFTLAFVVADSKKNPSWGGVAPLSSLMVDQIAALRALGGDVVISFGGANGQELGQAITNVDDLVAAYASVAKITGVKRFDFDIEGGATADRASVVRRNKAIVKLQKQIGAIIGYCLPVMPDGLDNNGRYVIQSALQEGVVLEKTTIMTMDYGGPYADMGQAAIDAATNTKKQLEAIGYANVPIGICNMIGENDVPQEVFDLPAARKVLAFAKATPWVKSLHMWSTARDKTGQLGVAAADGSGIKQNPWDFSKIFVEFEK
jgi:hypothetical protein